MRLKEYLITEVFNKDVDVKVVKDNWQEYQVNFEVANDIYQITAQILTNQYDKEMKQVLTDKELKSLTGYSQEDIKKSSGGMIPINPVAMKISEFFRSYPLWVFGFGSRKYGDKILDIRTREEVAIIFSAVKKAAKMFIQRKEPPLLIIDAKSDEAKRLPIYKRFVKEILNSGDYELMGGQRKFNYFGVNTMGWLLKRKGIKPHQKRKGKPHI